MERHGVGEDVSMDSNESVPVFCEIEEMSKMPVYFTDLDQRLTKCSLRCFAEIKMFSTLFQAMGQLVKDLKVFNVWLSSHIWLFRLVSSQLIAACCLDQRQRASFSRSPVFLTAAWPAHCHARFRWTSWDAFLAINGSGYMDRVFLWRAVRLFG
ncbi:hypothetical protein EYF80_038905 [Liparis tanakae]|uniref:Uncharacterized protein n=1 Tax=Liparis tanakae TaxID=230148 RepID=A0A4Z2GCB5_9TELE|nr:hypothetical protein EYF80_038905 [Liparis tanakae]